MILGLVGMPAEPEDPAEGLVLGEDVEMRPVTLVFSHENVEVAYRDAQVDKALPLGRFALIAAVGLYAIFGLLDHVLFPADERNAIWGIRFVVVVPTFALLLASTYVERVQRHVHIVLIVALLVGGLGIIAMTVIAMPPRGDMYYAGLIVVLFFGYALMPLRFVHATAVGWGLLLVYQATAMWVRPVAFEHLLNNDFFFVTCNLLGMGAAYIIERHRRRDFVALRVIERERKALRVANRRLGELAIRDALTGLMNRRTLMERLAEAIGLHKRYGVISSVLLIDLDDFKRVNDSLGHVSGDSLLRAVANAIRNDVRAPDQAFRYGGDEFVVLLPNTPPEIAAHLAHRLMEKVCHHAARQLPEGFGVGCSVGVAAVRAGIETGEEVLAEVDEALYRAKGDGKGCVAIYAVSSGRVATG